MPAPSPESERDLLRVATAGSVDDGKSTLLGRLLHDVGAVPDDQLAQVARASRRRGERRADLALLTDGLRAEREQRITIDVAYRHFATPRRRFLVADTPGHERYTRNLFTGASSADVAILLVDARKGLTTQSKRHAFVVGLLRVPHVVVAVNKMDLVGWSSEVFDAIRAEFVAFAARLGIEDLRFLPISALHGDHVVTPSPHMPWYDGGTLLRVLEDVHVGARRNRIDFRFPVQYVIRPHQDYRGLAGRIASGAVRCGEEVVVLPSGEVSRVAAIETFDGPLEEAEAGESIVLRLEDDLDVSRGAWIARPLNVPTRARGLDAMVCWMAEQPLLEDREVRLVHGPSSVRARVAKILYRVDVDDLHRRATRDLSLNDVGRVRIECTETLCFDRYALNRATGSFLVVDPHDGATLGAGMIREAWRPVRSAPAASTRRPRSPDVRWEETAVSRAARERRHGHAAGVVWLTGLPAAGKTTLGRALERTLFERGWQVALLDGDRLRHGLCGDLGFTPADRRENVRRAAEAARLLFEQGCVVICALVSPYAEDRAFARSLLPAGRFFEVFVDTPLAECERRDPKRLYARARRGELFGVTGIDQAYEPPRAPEIRVVPEPVERQVESVLEVLDRVLGSPPEA